MPRTLGGEKLSDTGSGHESMARIVAMAALLVAVFGGILGVAVWVFRWLK
jgi:hypothetical protein